MNGYVTAMTNLSPPSAAFAHLVIDGVSRVSGVPAARISPGTDVVFCLGMAGDDGADLISDIRRVTGASLREYDFYQHFGPEAAFAMHGGKPLTVVQLALLVEAELAGC